MPGEVSMERWVPYVLDNRWEVSDHGRIRSWALVGRGGVLLHRATEPRILTLVREATGYFGVRIGRPLRSRRIHDLVAEHFLGPRPAGLLVCHNDGDRGNNHVGNLRYDTPLANQQDRLLHGTYVFGERAYGAKLSEELAVEIVRCLLAGEAQASIARRMGAPVTTAIVGHIAKGNSWKHVWSKFNRPIPQPLYITHHLGGPE